MPHPLRLALELQNRFHELNWGTQKFDIIYREAELEGHEDTTKGEVQVMDNNTDTALWNGVRVRCGLHYGICDIKYDPITKGYDYYGPPINTAARIESVCHGGQIGMSEEMRTAVFAAVGSAATYVVRARTAVVPYPLSCPCPIGPPSSPPGWATDSGTVCKGGLRKEVCPPADTWNNTGLTTPRCIHSGLPEAVHQEPSPRQQHGPDPP